MEKFLCLIIGLFIFGSTISKSRAIRVQDQMYISFDRVRYCVRRLNATHEIGCQSSMRGNSGYMYLIDNQTQMDSYLSDSNMIDSYGSFILMVNLDLFDARTVDRLINRLDKKLNGMLLYIKSNATRPTDFSTEDQCPNHRQSFYLNQTVVNWNPKGNGLFFRSFPFPIMLIDELDDYQQLVKFYNKYHLTSSTSSCGLEMKVFQNAAHTSKTCMRRNDISHSIIDEQEVFCDPVGGLNIYSKLPQSITVQPNVRPPNSVVLIIARTDSFQMFLKSKGSTGGVQQPAAALISFFALAHLIGQEQAEFLSSNKEIIFLTLDGDALDYSASFRFMFDMAQNYFPTGNPDEQRIQSRHIHSIIELQSISNSEQLWLHSSPARLINQTFINTMTNLNPKLNQISANSPIPPASSQIFLRQTSSADFPAYIFTSINQSQLQNHYYHSFLDDLSTVNINLTNLEYNSTTDFSQWIKDFVEPLAQGLLLSLAGKNKTLTIDQEIVNNLVYCVLKNLNCPLIHNITNQSISAVFESFDGTSMPFSINTYPTSTTPTFPFVKNVLAYFLRDRSFDSKNLTESECKDLAVNDTFSFYNYVGGYIPSIEEPVSYPSYCVRSYIRSSSSISPAFSIVDYDLSSTEYPAWTESRWSTVSVRLFIIPSRTREIITLLVGVSLFLISFVVLLLLRLYTKISLLQPSSS